MKKTLLFLSAFTCAVSQSNAQDCTKLFISEYVEGSGNDKALELFNPTGSPINLSGYSIQRFSNGDATSALGGVTNLTGTIAAYSTFVIANGQMPGDPSSPACSPALQALADALDGAYPAPTYMNGNDAIALFNGTTMIDLMGAIGDPGMASGQSWSDVFPYDGSAGAFWTKDQTLKRKASVKVGVSVNPDPFIVTQQWDSLPKDTWSGLGTHACDCVLGLNNLGSAISFAVFPNPAVDGIFNISSTELISEIEISNLLGQVVFFEKSIEALKSKNISASNLDKGMYQILIKYANNSISKSTIVIL
jgi:hypothetical protein